MIIKLVSIINFLYFDIVLGCVGFLLPRKNLFIYSVLGDKNFNYNPRLLFEYAEQRKVYKDLSIQHAFILKNISSIQKEKYKGVDFIDPLTTMGALKVWRAKAWITASRPIFFNPLGFLRIKYFNVWHGTPFKGTGLTDREASLIAKIRYRYYGLVVTKIVAPSDYFGKVFERSYGVKKNKIMVSGSPVTEFLYDKTLQKLERIELDKSKINVLYAPTWRSYNDNIYLNIDADFIEKLEQLYECSVDIYYRPHPFMPSKTSCYTKLLDKACVEELSYNFNEFDLVITDYSAMGVDAMIGGIPVILYWKDLERYIAERGFGVPKSILRYSHVAICESEIYEKIKLIISEQSPLIDKEIYHIEERRTCSLFFTQLKKELRL